MHGTSEKEFLELPYEIRTIIYKKLHLKDIEALALTNKDMLTTYINMDKHIGDKISFDSARDRFKQCHHLTCLKKINLDFFSSNISFNECIEFCLKQRQIEKIKIHDMVYDGLTSLIVLHQPINLEHLTVLEIDFMIEPRDDVDYLLPFVQNTTALKKLIYKNGILSKASMEQISKSKNMECMKLQNVFTFNLLSFKSMITSIKKLKTFHYFYFHFTRLMSMVRALETILDMTPYMPKLTNFKISVWQELNLPYLNQTIMFTRNYQTFKLVRGNAASFFRAIVPLINTFRLSDFELIYINESFPLNQHEKATIKYMITDIEFRTVKHYNYITE